MAKKKETVIDLSKSRYLCIGPNVWGKGETLVDAVKKIKSVAGSGLRKKDIKFIVIPHNVDPHSVALDDMGSICWRYLDPDNLKPEQRWSPGGKFENLP